MKKYDWIVLIILLVSPILINYLILGISVGATVNGSIDGWLGFYGTLVGSLITMFVLYRTRTWNVEDNTDTRNMQSKILKYQAKKVWFEGLRKQIDANYRILNFQETINVVTEISSDNYNSAFRYLMQLNKDIEIQSYSFDLYLSGDELNEYEINYVDCYNNILKKYGEFVNDLILICGIRICGVENIQTYINDCVKKFEQLHDNIPIVNASDLLIKLEKVVNSEIYTFEEVWKLCESRIQEGDFIHSEKMNLQIATNQLLKFEEKEIEGILL